jgi:hypothetical protein
MGLEEWPSSTEFGLQACLPLCPPVPQGVGGHHLAPVCPENPETSSFHCS